MTCLEHSVILRQVQCSIFLHQASFKASVLSFWQGKCCKQCSQKKVMQCNLSQGGDNVASTRRPPRVKC